MEQTLKKGNGLAVAGFILSLLAFLAALLCLTDGLVIILTVLRWIFVLPGLGLSIAGVCVNRPKKGLAITGIVLSLLAIALPYLILG